MTGAEKIKVEVVYARPEEQALLSLEMEAGATLHEAVERSGILQHFPEIEPDKAKMGIFGKLQKADTVLRDGDRVEIYRPLIADPKEVRRNRAAQGKVMKKGSGTLEKDA